MKGILFDLDGTLIDSMGVWQGLDQKYVESKGHVFDPRTTEELKAVSLEMAPAYFNKIYDMGATLEDMLEFMYGTLEVYYREKFVLKEGVQKRLEELRAAGYRMCITTATESPLTNLLVGRLGLDDFMEFVLTPDRAETQKNDPAFLRMAMEKLGLTPENTYVFDDALYALEIAKDLGMNTVGIYDATSGADDEHIRAIADHYIVSFADFDIRQLPHTEMPE
ncbi:MAG: HAD family phosphatase [Tissierellia bacterium]|nr:HAD family phosphatase [Tissierellia bacterium]